MFERSLIEHCSPTLASIKTASLFTITYQTRSNLHTQLDSGTSGSAARASRSARCGTPAACPHLLYRENQLSRDLRRPGVASFLGDTDICPGSGRRGGASGRAAAHVRRLSPRDRLVSGLSLGDVVGFIANADKTADAAAAGRSTATSARPMRQFARLRKCREIYARLWSAAEALYSSPWLPDRKEYTDP